jgi:hypothetical protein
VVDVDYNDFDPAAGAERKERSDRQPDEMSSRKEGRHVSGKQA